MKWFLRTMELRKVFNRTKFDACEEKELEIYNFVLRQLFVCYSCYTEADLEIRTKNARKALSGTWRRDREMKCGSPHWKFEQ